MVITAHAPSTSANLGPGFDALALALDVLSSVQARPSETTRVVVCGEGEGELPTGANNLVYRAVASVFTRHGQEAPPLELTCDNAIPLARGLGSSAAATAAGLLIGNELCDRSLSRNDLLELGVKLEGHADNLSACLFGGIQVSVAVGSGGVVHCPVRVPAGLRAVVLVPSFPMDTREARKLLPQTVALEAAVHNIGRTALLVAALAQDKLDLLRTATEDVIHQPPRQALFPALPTLLDAALTAGALGAFLSGAGSSVLALVEDDAVDRVAEALTETAKISSVDAQVMRTSIRSQGAQVTAA